MSRALAAAGLLAGLSCATAEERAPRPAADDGASAGPPAAVSSREAEVAAGAPLAVPSAAPSPSALGAAPSSSAPAPAPSARVPPAASSAASAPPSGAHERLLSTPLALDGAGLPFFFTASFDGSQRFSGWLEALAFARSVPTKTGRPVTFTFFVNTCFFDTAKVPSTIGRARTRDEVLVRRALAQIAVNEGHEIASHGVGHHDGSGWDLAAWREELDAFHRVADGLVFEPVRGEDGRAVFPRFSPLPGAAPGAAGAACATDQDCTVGRCADLGDAGRLCAPPCNLKRRCGEGLVCGAPFFREDEDVCLPRPDLPVEHEGQVLFDDRGAPRLRQGGALRPLRARGFRAPYLGTNDAMIEALIERGYRYDTSLAAPPGPPRDVGVRRGGPTLLELGLSPWAGALTIPMDYNYLQLKASGARMTEDYRRSILAAFAAGRVPFNVGHHFAEWEGGAYQRALEDAVRFAAAECPDEAGRPRCPGAVVASFAEVAAAVERARATPR